MTGTARFVCSDPDAGDLEFADVEAVLDALEAALLQPVTPIFDAVRQSWQPAGLHPEVRAAWEARIRYRPPSPSGLTLPELPSMTAIVRSLSGPDAGEGDRRREAYARVRGQPEATERTPGADRFPRLAAAGVLWALALLTVVAWLVVTFAARLSDLAAAAAGVVERR